MPENTAPEPTVTGARRDVALLQVRLVAADIAQLHAGLLELGRLGALADKLQMWSSTLASAERTLRETP